MLAALDGAINIANAKNVKAPIIIELANGPIDEAAYQILVRKNKTILPDIIANAGGVVVSYLEWLQNKQGKSWNEEKVNHELSCYMVKAVKKVYGLAGKEAIPLKDAALRIALKRLATS